MIEFEYIYALYGQYCLAICYMYFHCDCMCSTKRPSIRLTDTSCISLFCRLSQQKIPITGIRPMLFIISEMIVTTNVFFVQNI